VEVENPKESYFKENLPTGVSLGETLFPLEIKSESENMTLPLLLEKYKGIVNELLYKYGAIRFRGFNIDSALKLEELVHTYTTEVLDYIERGAPRLKLAKKVYTSTEYAKEEHIPLHHEMSYSNNWPSKLFFACIKPSKTGGFTPIANDREVIKKIPDLIKRKFIDKKVMYVRNYGLGVDMSWQDAFNTNDKSKAEAYLNATGTEYEWITDKHLKTTAKRQVIARHPITRETVWFNHAHLFHMSNMPKDIRDFLVTQYSADGLPRNAFYGDGTNIEDSDVEEIRRIYNNAAVTFQWEKGDVLLLDNFLVSHGRSSYEGERKICVAMTEMYKQPV
jgi:alpha-ketoglutarate-dependent taurine dioxygenase